MSDTDFRIELRDLTKRQNLLDSRINYTLGGIERAISSDNNFDLNDLENLENAIKY